MSTHATLLRIVDPRHLSAIVDVLRPVVRSARAYLNVTSDRKGTRTSNGHYRKGEIYLSELRRRMAAAGLRNVRHRLFTTEEEQDVHDALETLDREVGEEPQAPPSAGALPPLPTEAVVARLEDILKTLEGFLALARAEKLTKEERNNRVRDYLKKHKARAAKGDVGIREVSQETGVPTTSIQNTPAWHALQDKLEEKGLSRRPRKRKAQAYTAEMDTVVDDESVQDLIREQKSDYEPSPCDKGRRPKVRAKKKF